MELRERGWRSNVLWNAEREKIQTDEHVRAGGGLCSDAKREYPIEWERRENSEGGLKRKC